MLTTTVSLVRFKTFLGKLLEVESLDLKEMSTIIEMMDNIDGVKPGEIRYDGHGNPEPLPTARNSFNVEIKMCLHSVGGPKVS